MPIRAIDHQEMVGRGTTTMGRQASRKRTAVSCGAEKLSSPNFTATNPKPQITEVRAASTMSRSLIARTLHALLLWCCGSPACACHRGLPTLHTPVSCTIQRPYAWGAVDVRWSSYLFCYNTKNEC